MENQGIIEFANLYPKIKGYNRMNGVICDIEGVSQTIRANSGGHNEVKIAEPQALRMARTEEGKRLRNQYEAHEIECGFNEHRIAEPREDGCSNTLSTAQKDNYVAIPQATKRGFAECEIGGVADFSYPNSETRRGRVQDNGSICPTITAGNSGICRIEPKIAAIRGRNPENPSDRTAGIETQQRLEIGGDCSNALTTVQKDNVVVEPSVRVRKLTPREYFRLMGFLDEDFDKAASVNSNSQLYKQSGNSIVVNVLTAIFGQMIDGKEDVYKQSNP